MGFGLGGFTIFLVAIHASFVPNSFPSTAAQKVSMYPRYACCLQNLSFWGNFQCLHVLKQAFLVYFLFASEDFVVRGTGMVVGLL